MPRSNSSFGVADGGKVVSVPAALALRGGGGKAPAGLRGAVLAGSSGSPAPRPPGAPIGASAGTRSAPPPHAPAAPLERSDSDGGRSHRHGADLAVPAERPVIPRRSAPAGRSAGHNPAGPVAARAADKAAPEAPRPCWAGRRQADRWRRLAPHPEAPSGAPRA